MDQYNSGTIFAYGQTSSGKTYTMHGTESEPGVIFLSLEQIFDIIKEVWQAYNFNFYRLL